MGEVFGSFLILGRFISRLLYTFSCSHDLVNFIHGLFYENMVPYKIVLFYGLFYYLVSQCRNTEKN